MDMPLFTVVRDQFSAIAASYMHTYMQAAQYLLVSLGVIQLVLTFGFMAVRGELELTGAAAQLLKTALIIGFFSMIIQSPNWLFSIFDGLDTLANNAGGQTADIDKFGENIKNMWIEIGKAEEGLDMFDFFPLLAMGLGGLLATVVISYMAGSALAYYAFAQFSIFIGVFWVGFGSFDQTRPWAIHAITNVFRWSAKWTISMLFISIAFKFVDDTAKGLTNDFSYQGIAVFIFVSLMLVTVNAGIGGFVDSYFTGGGGGDNSRGMQMAQTAAAVAGGAAIGMSAGASQGAKQGIADTKAAADASGTKASGMQMMKNAFSGGLDGANKGGTKGMADAHRQGLFRTAIEPPNALGGSGGREASKAAAGGSSEANFATNNQLGADSGLGGINGTVGNAGTEPKPNPTIVS